MLPRRDATWLGWPKTEPEVNSHDVISRTSGTNVGRSQRLTIESSLVHRSQTQSSWRNVPNSLMKIQDDGGRHIELRKMSIYPDSMKIFPPNLMDRYTTAIRRWPHEQKLIPEVNSGDVIRFQPTVASNKHKHFKATVIIATSPSSNTRTVLGDVPNPPRIKCLSLLPHVGRLRSGPLLGGSDRVGSMI